MRRRVGTTIITKLDTLTESLERGMFEVEAIPMLVNKQYKVS